MKKTAFILLFIFTLVQVLPAVRSLLTPATSVFLIIDEEKNAEKTNGKEKSEKKYVALVPMLEAEISQKINTAFHHAEAIQTYPCLEKLTPPPNYC